MRRVLGGVLRVEEVGRGSREIFLGFLEVEVEVLEGRVLSKLVEVCYNIGGCVYFVLKFWVVFICI